MIKFHEKSKTFHLYNEHISYLIAVEANGQLSNLYFGKQIKDKEDYSYLMTKRSVILAPCSFHNNLSFTPELLRHEYPDYGRGDYKTPAFILEDKSTCSEVSAFKYDSYKIIKGKEKLSYQPSVFGTDINTLEITLKDDLTNATLVLAYSIFDNKSSIVRSAKFINNGKNELNLKKALSMSIDFYDKDFDFIQLDGAWSRERHININSITTGVHTIGSTRGSSSAMHNPFFALKRQTTNENNGEVYGFSLVYSGNFIAGVDVDNYDVTRAFMGIHPDTFSWNLKSNEEFLTPEVIMVYSDKGISNMSQTFHNVIKNNLITSKYAHTPRPILINNWEATYFDFNEKSILDIAMQAKELGVEMFVLDDGWFGKRNDDTSSLGDWYSDKIKLPDGVEALSKKITDSGMKFGLWFEPEMCNIESELYKNHPDWIISTPGRDLTYGRNQLVLDFSNKDVVDFIYNSMEKVISNSKIDYIKWDMNRNITESYAKNLPKENQKEFFHRYILGVYDLFNRLTTKFPNILFEACASGGNRFDCGMLYYAPQIWASDNTDAIERLSVLSGTSMVYPISSIGSHVSACPNHQLRRTTSLKMRADVAMIGTFGYELNLNILSDEEKKTVVEQIEFFKEYREVIQTGDFYRLDSKPNYFYYQIVSKDKNTVLLFAYKVLATANPGMKKVRLVNLLDDTYTCINNKKEYYGSELENFGLELEVEFTGLLPAKNYPGVSYSGSDIGDFTSQVYVFKRK